MPAVQGATPAINADFMNPGMDPDSWVERFEREGREVYDHRQEIVKIVGLKPGARVADIGAGTGLFTFLFAEAVGPTGLVYAVDISPALVAHLRSRAAASGDSQVVPVLGAPDDPRLPPSSVDRVFLCDTYHHFEQPGPMLAAIHKALRPKGELVLVEFKRIPGVSSEWMLNHVRAGQEVFEAEIISAGFRKVGEPLRLEDNYVTRFRRVSRGDLLH